MSEVLERFIKYISYNTKSDELSKTFPSTKSQLIFGEVLAKDLKEIGMDNVSIDKYGYVTATLPSNTQKELPTIGFIAHMDTSPDMPENDIKPNIVKSYNGEDIVLKKHILSSKDFPVLKDYIGDTIITTDGTTLLGADDKAGISAIITSMDYMIKNPDLKHGNIRVAFTPDEEIGKGADYFNIESFGADFAYTIDGGHVGELEYENFNAARAIIKINGKNVHPGSAKNIMINAGLIGTELVSLFPSQETPSTTEGYEGFYHLNAIKGGTSYCELNYIVRDFYKETFENRKNFIRQIVEQINKKYGNICTLEIRDEYYNMISEIEKNMFVVDLAKMAMENCNITPIIKPIRGGTDGARLSFMGLPCPNIFAGGYNFHGPLEFVPLSSLEKCVQVIIGIIRESNAYIFKNRP